MTRTDPHRVTNFRDVRYLKPKKFRDHLTITEVARHVKRDVSWIRRLEKKGRIPKAHRVTRGQIEIRLWSPAQVAEIERIIAGHKVGRPPGDG